MIQELVNKMNALKRRVRRLEDIVPESIETPDEGGVVIVKITGVHSDSPGDDTTPHMFTGDVYTDGSRNDPTEINVTIAIAGIPPGFKNFPDFPQNAVITRQSWTGASGDKHAETLYEVEIPWSVFVYQITSTSSGSIDAKPVDDDGNTVGNAETFGNYDVTI